VLYLIDPAFAKLHLSIIQSSTLLCHGWHVIIWLFKDLLWPQRDPFQVVALQILCIETVWIHSSLEEFRHAYKSHFIDADVDADAHGVVESIQIL
jgi:hypothetical protein